MADHVIPKPASTCLVCGAHPRDAHRVACTAPLFPPYEAAVDLFRHTVGIGPKITAIRSPRKLLDKFRAEFPHESSYAGAPVELAEQDHLSVRGTTITGRAVECPEPE
jgi:hypothetical protein